MNIDKRHDTARMKIERHRSTIYKTVHFTSDQIAHMQKSGSEQEKTIARWFWNHPDTSIGPGKLHQLNEYAWPLTSTRRSITNLTDAGILEKTHEQRMGPFGKPESQ